MAYSPPSREIRAEVEGKNLKAGVHEWGDAYCFDPHDLLWLVSYTTQDYLLGGGTTPSDLGLPHQ